MSAEKFMRSNGPTQTRLHSLIYFSLARGNAASPMTSLRTILSQSQTRNAQAGITGALLSCGGFFLQVLEGSPAAVLETYQRIANDTRHHSPALLWEGPIIARQFPRWSMCGGHFDATDAAIISVLEARGKFQPERLTPGQADDLLQAVQNLQAPQVHLPVDPMDDDVIVYV